MEMDGDSALIKIRNHLLQVFQISGKAVDAVDMQSVPFSQIFQTLP